MSCPLHYASLCIDMSVFFAKANTISSKIIAWAVLLFAGRVSLAVLYLFEPSDFAVTSKIVIPNYHGDKLVGILHETGSKEVAIVCHGIQSSKERIPMLSLAVGLEKIGISAFRFDFTGNGESEGIFRYGNYFREVEDLRAVVQHFRGIGRAINSIIGHSKGGNVVLLYASKYHDVCTVVNISGRFDVTKGIEGRLGEDYLERVKRNGFIDVYSKKGKLQFRVTEESLMDRLSTDIQAACRLIQENCRILTVHGSSDPIVPVEDAKEFDKVLDNHVLQIIEGADHEFTLHQDVLVMVVLKFIRERLGNYGATEHPFLGQGVASVNSKL